MYGADVNRLNMYFKTVGSSRFGAPYWTKVGTHGDQWRQAQVEFSMLINDQVSNFTSLYYMTSRLGVEQLHAFE